MSNLALTFDILAKDNASKAFATIGDDTGRGEKVSADYSAEVV